jgi:hypothetical protein
LAAGVNGTGTDAVRAEWAQKLAEAEAAGAETGE